MPAQVGARDALMTLPQERYGPDYLAAVVYPRMAAHVPPDAYVVEVGCRQWERGVLSQGIIPHARFTVVDRDRERAQACGAYWLNVLETPIAGDAILSTCVLHHTPEKQIPELLANLGAPLLMFSGPTADTHEPYGDHEWHLEEGKLRGWLGALGYEMTWERIGLTEPYCETLVIAKLRIRGRVSP